MHCLDCANATHCLLCDHAQDAFLNESTGSCEVCDAGFYIPAPHSLDAYLSPHCFQCAIEGCLVCLSRSRCKQCDRASGYFLHNFECSLCGVEGCKECSSWNECSACDEGNGYFLDEDSSTCVRSEPMDRRVLVPLILLVIMVLALVGLISKRFLK